MHNRLSVSVAVHGHLSLSRLQGAVAKLLYFSVEHMSSLRDRSA